MRAFRASPAFSMAHGDEHWLCYSGQEALREYLQLESAPPSPDSAGLGSAGSDPEQPHGGTVDVPTLSPRDFAAWLLRFVQRQRESSPVFRQRETIRDLEIRHEDDIAAAKGRLERAKQAYEALPAFPRMLALDARIKKLGLTIAGIQSFLTTNEQDRTNDLSAKCASAQEKLAAAEQEAADARAELDALAAANPERQAFLRAEAGLEELLVGIGLRREEQELQQLHLRIGEGSRVSGTNFEDLATHAIAAALRGGLRARGAPAAPAAPSAPALAPGAASELQNLSARAKPQDDSLICVLSNVTLGLAAGEMDKVVVRVRQKPGSQKAHKAPSNPQGQSPGPAQNQGPAENQGPGPQHLPLPLQVTGTDGEREEVLVPGDLIMGCFEVEEVLALVECKKNPDDLGASFNQYQNTLAWLTGDQSAYSAEHMQTKFHSSGHFTKPTMHTEDGREFTFRPSSFNGFSRDPASGHFLEGLVLVAFLGRSGGQLCGIDSSSMGKLTHRLSSIPNALPAIYERQNLDAVKKIQDWLFRIKPAPLTAAQVLQLYLQTELLSRHILLMTVAHDSTS